MHDHTRLQENPATRLLSRPQLIGFLWIAFALFLESGGNCPLQFALP